MKIPARTVQLGPIVKLLEASLAHLVLYDLLSFCSSIVINNNYF